MSLLTVWRRTATDPVPPPVMPEQEVAQQTPRERAIELIVTETSTTLHPRDAEGAERFIVFHERVRADLVTHRRRRGRGAKCFWVVGTDLDEFHDTMLTVTPDDVIGVPGTAHYAMDCVVYGTNAAGEPLQRSLHTSDFDGPVRYCAYTIEEVPVV